MEDVLAVYRRPVDPRVPLVGCDESGKELQQELRPAMPARHRHPRKVDDGVQRKGSASLLLTVAPFLGWRPVQVTRRRPHREWAHAMRDLVDLHFPDADRIGVVRDHLNPHVKSALDNRLPAEEAFRISQKLEFQNAPVHGAWLNLAEIEFRLLHRQCLRGRRFPSQAALTAEVRAGVAEQNQEQRMIQWRFTPEDARQAMPDTYPIMPKSL